MSLRILGAGVGRTGTLSLKLALERLLGKPCYHMFEVFSHPDHVPVWHQAARGEACDWDRLFDGYAAAVDWPAASYWPELSAAYPDAKVVLSRRDPESWWRSASATIFPAAQRQSGPWREMIDAMFSTRFTLQIDDKTACLKAYEQHVDAVRRGLPASRLIEWEPADGWAPLCAALDVPIPDEPFPRENSTADFLSRGL